MFNIKFSVNAPLNSSNNLFPSTTILESKFPFLLNNPTSEMYNLKLLKSVYAFNGKSSFVTLNILFTI